MRWQHGPQHRLRTRRRSRLQADAGVEDSPELFVDDVDAQSGGSFDRVGLRRLARVSADVVHWLIDDVGIPFRLTEDYRHVGHSVTRLHNPPGREGATLVSALRERARDHGALVHTLSPVVSASRSDSGY